MIKRNEFNQPIGVPIDNWKKALSPPKTVISGQYCKIVPLNINEHSKCLFDSFAKDADNKNWTYMPYGPFDSFSEFKLWLINVATNTDLFFYAVIDIKNNNVVGLASYLRINKLHGVIEVGHIHFSPSLQKTTMATEAMFLMMQQVFDILRYRRYEWKCDSLNEKSRKAALRLGFTFEGIFRQAVMYKGRNRDTAWYSIIDSEWPRLKQAFMLWLNPSNFDSKGSQIKSLSYFKDNLDISEYNKT